MRRRKLLIGIGAAAAGGSAAFGTEAFTSVQAERSVDVSVAGDDSAFVAIQSLDSDNADTYVDTESDNTVELNLDGDSDSPGDGVNQDAVTQLDDLFRVVNQGSQETSVYFEDESDAVTFRVSGSASALDATGQSLEGADNSVELDVGEQVVVGLTVDTLNNDVSGELLDSVTLVADANASAPEQNVPQPQYVVTDSPSGDNEFDNIGDAVAAAESGSVVGIDSSFDSTPEDQVSIGTEDLTLTGFDGRPTVDLTGVTTDEGAIQVASDGVTLQNIDITYDAGNATNGIESNSGNKDVTVDGIRLENTGDPTGNPGINLEQLAGSVTATNNEVLGAPIGVYFSNGDQDTTTISNNYVDLNPGADEPASGGPTEGIFAYGSGASSTDFEIENNEVVDKPTGEEGIKVLNSPNSINGESGTEAQLESLLRENSISEADVSGELGTKSSGFSDIQSAVDAATRLTLVESGTYSESVSISSANFALKGPNAGTPGQDSARGNEATITAPSGSRAVNLNADGAEINGLRVEGGDNATSIIKAKQVDTSNEVIIKNSIIRASNGASGFKNGIEISNGSSIQEPVSATIESNDIKINTGTKGAAINILGGVDSSANHDSITIRSNKLRGDIGGYRATNTLTVEDNLILPATEAAPDSAMDVEAVSSATFTDNTFRGNVGDTAYDDDGDNAGGATANDVLNNNGSNSGNTFEPNAETATSEDDDDVIQFTYN